MTRHYGHGAFRDSNECGEFNEHGAFRDYSDRGEFRDSTESVGRSGIIMRAWGVWGLQ